MSSSAAPSRRPPPADPIQTFLPYADFTRTAAVLDDRRLGKQRVETLQVMQVLVGLRWDNERGVIERYSPKGWRAHPVVLMWQGYEPLLGDYQHAVCAEWVRRGFRDTCDAKTSGLLLEAGLARAEDLPPWLGDPALHRSHQSNLVRKDPAVYAARFPAVPADLPYLWPVPPRDHTTGGSTASAPEAGSLLGRQRASRDT